MQWEFHQIIGIQVLEDLSGSRAVSDSFVIAKRRIISETRFLECNWRVRIKVKPVHSNTNIAFARDLLDGLALSTTLCSIAPCIDAVHTDFMVC